MFRLNDLENFSGRIVYAAKVIARVGPNSHAFDNCLENDDGDDVVAAILRRSRKNAKLAANLTRYLNVALAGDCDHRMSDIPTRKLVYAARETCGRAMARRVLAHARRYDGRGLERGSRHHASTGASDAPWLPVRFRRAACRPGTPGSHGDGRTIRSAARPLIRPSFVPLFLQRHASPRSSVR